MLTYFAKNIKTIRKNEGLRVLEFGRRIGVSPKVVQAWEETRGRAKHPQLIKISEEFNVSIDDLLKRDLSIALDTSTPK